VSGGNGRDARSSSLLFTPSRGAPMYRRPRFSDRTMATALKLVVGLGNPARNTHARVTTPASGWRTSWRGVTAARFVPRANTRRTRACASAAEIWLASRDLHESQRGPGVERAGFLQDHRC
jgi:hypothetical protein